MSPGVFKMKNILKRKVFKSLFPGAHLSYSQFGEDLILEYLFSELGIKHPTYIDIGANDPRIGNNTYKFYIKGSTGVLIEPNPDLISKLRKVRPYDTILNIGLGTQNSITECEYFKFPAWASGLNTFSKENAEYWKSIGHKDFGKIGYEKVIPIKLYSVNDILKQYFSDFYPNFISLDVEGLDLDILKSIDFQFCKSEVICVETMGYDHHQNTYKRNDIIAYLQSMSYQIFADTRVNTIFCKTDLISQ